MSSQHIKFKEETKRARYVLKQKYPTDSDREFLISYFDRFTSNFERYVREVKEVQSAIKKRNEDKTRLLDSVRDLKIQLAEVCEFLLEGGKPRSVSLARKIINTKGINAYIDEKYKQTQQTEGEG